MTDMTRTGGTPVSHFKQRRNLLKPIRAWATVNNNWNWARWDDIFFMQIYTTERRAEDHLKSLSHHDLKIIQVEIHPLKQSRKCASVIGLECMEEKYEACSSKKQSRKKLGISL